MNAARAVAGALHEPYWLGDPARPEPEPALHGTDACDLAVVGGGYSGLWAALRAKEREPSLDVAVLEAGRIGGAASGRNGGFCAASLTHGIRNGADRWPDELHELERLGWENFRAIAETLVRYGIDAGWEAAGQLHVATAEWQLEGLAEDAELAFEYGWEPMLMSADAVRAELDSPTYLGGLWDPDGVALVNPAKLAWGLADACRSLGVRIYERTPVTGIEGDVPLRLSTRSGRLSARRVALGTGAFPPLLKRARRYVVPVYDYAMATEPLSAAQLESLGWKHRQGVGDRANLFHYYRLTADDRIVWGGSDAVYHFGGRIGDGLERRGAAFEALARAFFTTFPQLEGLRFSHAWGGVVDTCTRFCAFYGTAYDGRLAHAAGFTGLGVGATRFGADVMLDLLGLPEADPSRTRPAMVRERPVPFPPEPFRYAAIELTRRGMARADRDAGRRGRWLRALDRFGVGFGS
ncbi:FAD-dependent oxidoreductase [Spirillospora sp. NPDC029432]|uniref:NAD(P)/FAD-dependent oxidoreductase n=1 Tax=Spirillospora sp. NPDC029432 TaxID=3154599 RepID=UPI003455C35C